MKDFALFVFYITGLVLVCLRLGYVIGTDQRKERTIISEIRYMANQRLSQCNGIIAGGFNEETR